MSYPVDSVRLVKCPYDEGHIVQSFRYPHHIVKCKKKHPDVKFDACSFNFTHLVKREKMAKHLLSCPDRVRVEGNRYGSAQSLASRSAYCADEDSSDSDESYSARDAFYVDDLPKSWKEQRERELRTNRTTETEEVDAGRMPLVQLSKLGPCWPLSSLLEEGEVDLEPLPLPKTTSKAFRIQRS